MLGSRILLTTARYRRLHRPASGDSYPHWDFVVPQLVSYGTSIYTAGPTRPTSMRALGQLRASWANAGRSRGQVITR